MKYFRLPSASKSNIGMRVSIISSALVLFFIGLYTVSYLGKERTNLYKPITLHTFNTKPTISQDKADKIRNSYKLVQSTRPCSECRYAMYDCFDDASAGLEADIYIYCSHMVGPVYSVDEREDCERPFYDYYYARVTNCSYAEGECLKYCTKTARPASIKL